jgi:hypothetical protein
MPDESIIRDEDGAPTHVRVTSDDGSQSTLYEYDGGAAANLLNDHRGKPVEVSDHNSDGTTDAYTYDDSPGANLTDDHRGEPKNDSGSGCFLTTACVSHAGLTDDCHELTVLRRFRDTYVQSFPHGRALIAEYYASAPALVASLNESGERTAQFDTLLAEIRTIVCLIDQRQPADALHQYAEMVNRLKSEHSV